ncbi:hypothetical protein PF005_g22740 [Phytophthora fragariae]|uniref:CENP-V/GFA domain-containing protein n=1 Tax=Phytophthora fragariae TaxID=53985 RepID=A0A6A3QSF1_9STRA|nr:hypothetical protein PF003_g28455 [Phytophthora fragariae]KAE8926256.1 hypothetical protein PF009_g23552 [Phytophthora fragariae]KAE8982957.1 hypothetical protein PF011_g21400 [Phytophthora fragariae]KAE9081080.1 hypothetical protein PF010_g22134 [Phytophthora fragariae]KAE9081611.1 hypothetical protein PF007_g22597 [Phytophthora fragariae]
MSPWAFCAVCGNPACLSALSLLTTSLAPDDQLLGGRCFAASQAHENGPRLLYREADLHARLGAAV